MNEIVVGNIGFVYRGDSEEKAKAAFDEYVEQSRTNYGRAAGEDVAWFIGGEIHREYVGSRSNRL